MKKFVIRGISREYGTVVLSPNIKCDDDFEIELVEEYQGKDGEETYVTTHLIEQNPKETVE